MTRNVSGLVKVKPAAWRYRYLPDGKWTVQKNKPAWWRDGTESLAELEPLYSALTPAEQCFAVKDWYSVEAHDTNKNPWLEVPLSEALAIRPAEEVRREALEEVATVAGEKCDPWAERKIRRLIAFLIDTPQPKGGDDE